LAKFHAWKSPIIPILSNMRGLKWLENSCFCRHIWTPAWEAGVKPDRYKSPEPEEAVVLGVQYKDSEEWGKLRSWSSYSHN